MQNIQKQIQKYYSTRISYEVFKYCGFWLDFLLLSMGIWLSSMIYTVVFYHNDDRQFGFDVEMLSVYVCATVLSNSTSSKHVYIYHLSIINQSAFFTVIQNIQVFTVRFNFCKWKIHWLNQHCPNSAVYWVNHVAT